MNKTRIFVENNKKMTMNKVTRLAIFLFLIGIFQSFESVSSRTTHESRDRKRRQVLTGRNYNNNDDYSYDPYFLSSSPSFRQAHLSRHGDRDSELIASSNSVSNNLLAEGIVSASKSKDYYDPFYYFVPAPAYVGSRNRRNSHLTQPRPYHQMSSLSSSSLFPKNDQREVAYLYERNSKVDNNIFPNQQPLHRFQHRNPNQFLTKQQITQSRYNPSLARYYIPSGNSIDNTNRNYYDDRHNQGGSSTGLENGRGIVGDEAWSVQVGTQLKVNDDGRERNPEQYYVRDETRGTNRRYSASYY